MGYDFKSIEEKWEKVWDEKKAFKTDAYDFSKPKFFVMDMFPYPSAVGLHVGHVEGRDSMSFILSDMMPSVFLPNSSQSKTTRTLVPIPIRTSITSEHS